MCYAVPAWYLHLNCVLNLHLRHSACLLTVYGKLEFSILVKMLHNIIGHNTDFFLVFCFAACLPVTVLHDLLMEKFLVS